MAKGHRTRSLPGIKSCIDKMRKAKNSPMTSLGKKITRALGGGRKIPGCKYNPGG